jgi:hypothetical protein
LCIDDLSVPLAVCYGYTMDEQTGASHPLSNEFWHARHACGHAVYWSSPALAVRTAPWPCPWCGGESGEKVPQDVLMMQDRNVGVMAFRELLSGGRVPWPSDLPKQPDRILVYHLPDDSCCNA